MCAENDGAYQNHGNHLFGDQQLQGYLKNNQDVQQYEATACCADNINGAHQNEPSPLFFLLSSGCRAT